MAGRKRKLTPSELTRRYNEELANPPSDADHDAREPREAIERLDGRTAAARKQKTADTAALRREAGATADDIATLPVGRVRQVFSLYCEVDDPADHSAPVTLCTIRRTLARVSSTAVVAGDQVRYRPQASKSAAARPEGVVEAVLPRTTLLTRSDSFKARDQHPIVANATQMLIVVALIRPRPKWGLVDRMLVAASAGGLQPIVCVNKWDLATEPDALDSLDHANAALDHYAAMGIPTVRCSAFQPDAPDLLRTLFTGQNTVLAGHSGVGKSSLVRRVQPGLDIRVGEVSAQTDKGRHTTTSARIYDLDVGGSVIDTPGVKVFGLWNVSTANLPSFFPDIQSNTAPEWRRESYDRILESLR